MKTTLRQARQRKNAEKDWIYLIHHAHVPDRVSKMEILHHCQLSERKGLQGKMYDQKHVKDGKVFQHALRISNNEETPKVVYDHLNNEFKVRSMWIDGKEHAVITGPTLLRDVKWSAQDRG